jgi:hypothetical protein
MNSTSTATTIAMPRAIRPARVIGVVAVRPSGVPAATGSWLTSPPAVACGMTFVGGASNAWASTATPVASLSVSVPSTPPLVVKHASPTTIDVQVTVDEGTIVVEVNDGVGIDTSETGRSVQAGDVGLAMVRRRVEGAGGRLEIAPGPMAARIHESSCRYAKKRPVESRMAPE